MHYYPTNTNSNQRGSFFFAGKTTLALKINGNS
jgi:hypothetical protein